MAPRKQPWFRFYVEAMTDPKLRRLTPAQKWLWVVVLASAKQSHLEGWLMLTERESVTARDLADVAGMKLRDVEVGIQALEHLGLLRMDSHFGAWEVVAWQRRQYASDDVTTRTRKHRSKNTPGPSPDNDGTPIERSKNGDATDQRQRTDTEPEKEPPPSPPSDEAGTSLVPASVSAAPTGAEDRIFDAWRESTDHPRALFDAKRRKLIRSRLQEYPEEDLLDAVRGWRHSPHHRGENDRHTTYNDLGLLLRDAANVEKFRDLEQNPPRPHLVSNHKPTTVEKSWRNIRAVLADEA